MDLFLFSSLLQNLLHLQVAFTENDDSIFLAFQDKFCYNRVLQPAFTAETLSRISSEMQDNVFYGLQDELGISLILFRFEKQKFLVGPFVRTEFDDSKIQTTLMNNHIPASYAASIKLYYSAFPLISSTYVRNAIIAFIRAFSGKGVDFSYYRLRNTTVNIALPRQTHVESLDYSALHQRYDLENNFLRMIEVGDTENVMFAYRGMSLLDMKQNRYVNAVYQDPITGLSMLRALARKAAERGGASLIEIHEITQRAVQRIYASKNAQEQIKHSEAMIFELTDAVRRSKLSIGRYPPPIRKVVDHIQLNYSQKIPMTYLSELSGFTESYLSRTFKKEVGSTITQYIEILRCKKAAEMLEISQTAIQEISSYVGYEDNNYFSKVFKKQYGITPTEYRSTHVQK